MTIPPASALDLDLSSRTVAYRAGGTTTFFKGTTVFNERMLAECRGRTPSSDARMVVTIGGVRSHRGNSAGLGSRLGGGVREQRAQAAASTGLAAVEGDGFLDDIRCPLKF